MINSKNNNQHRKTLKRNQLKIKIKKDISSTILKNLLNKNQTRISKLNQLNRVIKIRKENL